MKREYPLFLIDRSKHSTYPFDFIACFDSQVGFVARVVPFFQNAPLDEFIEQSKKIPDSENTSIVYRFKNKGGIIVLIEDFLYNFEWTTEIKTRIRTLLKKALKKYLHAEVDKTPDGDLNIENQIKMMNLSIEKTKANIESYINTVGNDAAYYQLQLLESVVTSLKMLRDNQKYITLNLN